MTSRVVVLRARDAVALRAKVTVKFEEPQTQAIAEQVLDICQDLVRAVVREAPAGAAVLGFDAAIAAEVTRRVPQEPAVVRNVEIAGLHIVGDPGHLAQPTDAPDGVPAWLHAPPSPSTPASSDKKGPDRTGDRATPVHAFPAAKPLAPERRGEQLTPAQPIPAVQRQGAAPERRGEQLTPAQPIPVVQRQAAGHEHRSEQLTPVQPIPVVPRQPAGHERRGEQLTPVQPIPVVQRQPAGQQRAGDGGAPPEPPARPRDPFAATAQSAQPPQLAKKAAAVAATQPSVQALAQDAADRSAMVPHAPHAQAAAAQTPQAHVGQATAAQTPQAHVGQTTAAQTPQAHVAQAAAAQHSQGHLAHAPTMPAMAAQARMAPIGAVSPSRDEASADATPMAPGVAAAHVAFAATDVATAAAAASSVEVSEVATVAKASGIGAVTYEGPALGGPAMVSHGDAAAPGATVPFKDDTAAQPPRHGAPAERSPQERSHGNPSPGAYSTIGSADATPGPGAVRARDPFASTAVTGVPAGARGRSGSNRPPPGQAPAPAYPAFGAANAARPYGPRRSHSSGQLAAVSPEDAAARGSNPGGPPSVGRVSRTVDEPSASSRNYGLSGPPSTGRHSRTSDEPSASSRNYGLSGPPSTGRISRTGDEPSASSRSYSYLPAQSGSRSSLPPSRTTNRPPAAVAARRRAVASRWPLPIGAGPYEVARGLTPLFRDTAGRILVAFLRTYDLTVIRRVPFDAVESDILSSLTAPSDGAPGTYAASHASEIHRWREAFGAAKLDRLQREANLAAAALAHETFTAEAVPTSMTAAMIEGLAGSAFGDPEMLMDLGRYLYPAHETTSAETLANMIEVAGEDMPPGLEEALDPLFASLREEVAAAAEVAKEVMLTPA